MTEAECLRVLIVDDHALVRQGIADFIFSYDWMEPVGEVQNGAQAVEFCATHDVDVVLMDLVMPVMDGTEATRQIMALGKAIKIIVLTSFHEQDMVQQALKAGASGYLLKNVSATELSAAIRAADAGRTTLAPEATEALVNATRQEPEISFDLTDREQETLTLLVEGRSNLEIAEALSISTRTVKYHLTNIFTKLGVKNRVEAVTVALDRNLVDRQDQ